MREVQRRRRNGERQTHQISKWVGHVSQVKQLQNVFASLVNLLYRVQGRSFPSPSTKTRCVLFLFVRVHTTCVACSLRLVKVTVVVHAVERFRGYTYLSSAGRSTARDVTPCSFVGCFAHSHVFTRLCTCFNLRGFSNTHRHVNGVGHVDGFTTISAQGRTRTFNKKHQP